MNHKAIIAKITEVTPIPGADRIQLAKVLGENVVVSKEWGVGFKGVFFPVGVQLSEGYCHNNNLFRHSPLNKDPTKTGFFEDNRRVRAQPFLKCKSEGFFADIKSLSYATDIDVLSLPVGSVFDSLDGEEICRKYVNPNTKAKSSSQGKARVKKVEMPYFEKHMDTDQLKHFVGSIPKGALLSFHAKVHGTSARYSHTLVRKTLPKWKQFVNKAFKIFSDTEWRFAVGTRNVIINDQEKQGYHGSEKFRFEILEQLKPHMTKGMSVYGEIAGWANDRPIMPDHSTTCLKSKEYTQKYGTSIRYSYGCIEGEHRFHIYRISVVDQNGDQRDFSQKELERWCEDKGFNSTLEIYPQVIYDGDKEGLLSLVDRLTEREECLTECYLSPTQISEGIIIRVDYDKSKPKFYKNKSYAFRVMEGICKEVDPEDEC